MEAVLRSEIRASPPSNLPKPQRSTHHPHSFAKPAIDKLADAGLTTSKSNLPAMFYRAN